MTVRRLPTNGIHVVCPASTSNLGSGFDTLGMAVDRYLTLHLRPASDRERVDGLVLERRGTLEDLSLNGAEDLIVSTLMDRIGQLPGPVVLTADSDIPIGRGLGSSASARVAGEVLASMLMHDAVDLREVLGAATAGEGHPDNVAPAVLGGLVAAGMSAASHPDDANRVPLVRALALSPAIGWGFAAPQTSLSTRESRAALPEHWSRDVVARSLSRLARLIPALADPGPNGIHLTGLLEDELHVPYRLPLIPGAVEAVGAAFEAGAWGVTLSGAGSGLIVLGHVGEMEPLVAAMSKAFRAAAGPKTSEPEAFVLHPVSQGVRWGQGLPPTLSALRPPQDHPG